MEPINKRTKERAKKAAAEEQPAAPGAKTIPTGGYLWARDEEELVDYAAEEPATFSSMEDDFSVVGDDISPPTDEQHNISSTNNDFPANLAEADHMAGAKRSQFFCEGEPDRKASRSVGVGSSPPPYDINSTNNEERMILATLPTGGRVATSTSAALPSGGSEARNTSAALPMGGSSDPRIIPAALPMGGSEARRTSAALPMGGQQRRWK